MRSNKVTKSKCCLSVLRPIFYGSFGMQNSMVTFIFKFDPRKRQLQVKLGQIRSNFFFFYKICLSCVVLSKDSRNAICFYVAQLQMSKIAFQICDVFTFNCFFLPLHSQKQIYCFEMLYACCLYLSRLHIIRFL